jgi:hypothetical protein
VYGENARQSTYTSVELCSQSSGEFGCVHLQHGLNSAGPYDVGSQRHEVTHEGSGYLLLLCRSCAIRYGLNIDMIDDR